MNCAGPGRARAITACAQRLYGPQQCSPCHQILEEHNRRCIAIPKSRHTLLFLYKTDLCCSNTVITVPLLILSHNHFCYTEKTEVHPDYFNVSAIVMTTSELI